MTERQPLALLDNAMTPSEAAAPLPSRSDGTPFDPTYQTPTGERWERLGIWLGEALSVANDPSRLLDADRAVHRRSLAVWAGGVAWMALVIGACYAMAVGGAFIWLDSQGVNLPSPRDGVFGLHQIWTLSSATPFVAPLGQTLLWLQHRVFRDEPFGYHVVSLTLHLAVAMNVWTLLRQLFIPGALLAATLVAVHPAAVTPVSCLALQPILLGTLLALVSARFGLCYAEVTPRHQHWEDRRLGLPDSPPLDFALCLLFALLAVAAWPAAALLPAIAVASLGRWRDRVDSQKGGLPVRTRGRWLTVGLTVVAVVGIAVMAVATARSPASNTTNAGSPAPSVGLLRSFAGVALSSTAAMVPIASPRTIVGSLMLPIRGWVALLVVVALGLAALALHWRRRQAVGKNAAMSQSPGIPVPNSDERWRAGVFLLLGGCLAGWFFVAWLAPRGFPAAAAVYPVLAPAVALAVAAILRFLVGPLRQTVPARNAWIAVASFVVLTGLLAAVSWRASGDSASTSSYWTGVLADDPADTFALNARGQDSLAAGNTDAAIRDFSSAAVLDPQDSEPVANLGLAYESQGRPFLAADHYTQALRQRPNDVGLIMALASVRSRVGQPQAAIELYERALAQPTPPAAAFNNLAMLLAAQGKLDAAAQLCTAAIRISPNSAAARLNYATILFQLGRQREAAESLQEAARLEPNRYETYMNAGAMLAQIGAFAEAERMFRDAVRLKPDSPELWNDLGLSQAAQRRWSESIYSYQKAIGLSPDHHVAKVNLAEAVRRRDE